MRWWVRKQHQHAPPPPPPPCVQGFGGEEEESERKSKAKGKGFSFSPLSWLARLAAKHGAAAKAAPKHAAAVAKNGGGTPCLPKRTSPTSAVVAPARPGTPPRRSAAADEAVPRRLSVGNDNTAADAARRHCIRRRHCSLGGDHDLLPLGRLIPFSLAGSPARPPPPDTNAGAPRGRRRRHRRRGMGGGGGGGRRSFSGRMPPRRVRVRSPRRAPEQLERFAVVRRTRDPQRAFRESMVEMIAASGGGGSVGDGIAARPEELERLLACYLALNADEHHDCIVKVFRQVWFEHINLLPR